MLKRIVPAVLAGLMVVGAWGCSAGEQETGQPPDEGGALVADADPWQNMAAPALERRDVELPGNCSVTGVEGTLAVYEQFTGLEYPVRRFGVVDLVTGEYSTILSDAVNADERYSMFTPRLGDGWIAWEEVSQNEMTDPGNAYWRLYAAPLDPVDRKIGAPVLVDSGSMGLFNRPFYGFDGAELVWTKNLCTASAQESQAHHSELMRCALPAGGRTVVFRSRRNWSAVCVEGTRVTIIEWPEEGEESERIVVVDAKTGRTLRTASLPANSRSSHFVRTGPDGAIIYSAWVKVDKPRPNLYSVNDRGESEIVRANSVDAVPLGKWFLFERYGRPTRGAGTVSQICGLSSSDRAVFPVDESADGLWQMTYGTSGDTTPAMAVACITLQDSETGPERTVVRTYRVAEAAGQGR